GRAAIVRPPLFRRVPDGSGTSPSRRLAGPFGGAAARHRQGAGGVAALSESISRRRKVPAGPPRLFRSGAARPARPVATGGDEGLGPGTSGCAGSLDIGCGRPPRGVERSGSRNEAALGTCVEPETPGRRGLVRCLRVAEGRASDGTARMAGTSRYCRRESGGIFRRLALSDGKGHPISPQGVAAFGTARTGGVPILFAPSDGLPCRRRPPG